MAVISTNGLKKNVGRVVKIEREGVVGNILDKDGTIREGELIGILQKEEDSFYVKMPRLKPEEVKRLLYPGLVSSFSSILDEYYKVRDRDFVTIKGSIGLRKYLVRIN